MFQKPFKIKSQTILRGSDKKKLQTKVKEQFRYEEPVFTNKEEVKKLKIFFNKGRNVFVYCARDNPILFETEEKLYPTVYLLWELHRAVPRLKTHPHVIKILMGGADLMLPGVVVTGAEDYIEKGFEPGDAVSVVPTNSSWPVAVGHALVSSSTLLGAEDKSGKGVTITHTFGDHLWQMGQKTSPPKEDAVESVLEQVDQLTLPPEETLPEEGDQETTKTDDEQQQDEDCSEEEEPSESLEEIAAREKAEMDKLLRDCFMTALKNKLKDKDLPVLTSNFYRNGVMSCCPVGQTLDVKKSSHKKFGVFIKDMVIMDLIKVKEISKGSEGIVFVNRQNPEYRSFRPLTAPKEEEKEASTEIQYGILIQNSYTPPEISLLYKITPDVYGLFQPFGVRRNTSLPQGEIRKFVTQYVEMNELRKNGATVSMDPILHRAVCASNEGNILELPWKDVFERLMRKLKVDHQLKFPGLKPIIAKGPPPKITITLKKKINNKTVTLVKNLEKFLIDEKEFGTTVKKLAQASMVIVDDDTTKQHLQVVQIQGNQVHSVEKVLTENYKINRKYIEGLDKAPKKR